MDSADSADRYVPDSVRQAVKVLIVGAFGVGKTTLVGSVSEIEPLRTEETVTGAAVGVDALAGVEDKRTTTVAMDFGRLTLNDRLVMYLFGAPGQRRYWGMWDGLAEGALGVLAVVDTRRLAESFEVLAELELRGLPFVVAVNRFPDSEDHPVAELRGALDLTGDTPVVTFDARDRASSIDALITLVQSISGGATGPAGTEGTDHPDEAARGPVAYAPRQGERLPAER
ncbi:ATP/GTP-binding protein [Streptomyces sp. XM4011]|uniref:Signal recognition particle receptor subunit beta, a GTPase n=2 Tax=Streptomyces TaxID=1883 RepID=A0A1I6W6B9_9ACTN|nr:MULTISPECIES: ATP/GTP-binding protein [Streptomyces]MCK1815827.1 ATP/GTP-binding protein [Streptomyces sp. XM4011]QKV70371.1 ATP/GTP-binding protein [Streptomyces harbinensis]SFT21529.1 Signal recognition particle receptor subunit beta, a GTPase [Streptomyces harbinensis]